jgi:DNA-binding transcriptional regulator YiaG
MLGMPNLASALKQEITRLARKELRAEVAGLKKMVTAHRSEIAALKRRVQLLERALRGLARTRAAPAAEAPAAPARIRFSAKGLAAQRRRLGLSVSDCGLLLGTSGQSIYNWEAGQIRPRAVHLPAIAALRTMGRREAVARLDALRGTAAG